MRSSRRSESRIKRLRRSLESLFLARRQREIVRARSSRVGSGYPRFETLEDRVVLSVVVGGENGGEGAAESVTIGNNIGVGDQLRNYRLAVAATAEYTAFHGGQAAAFAQIQNDVAELNEIFEEELAIHFDLVSTTATVFTDAATDGYTNGDVSVMINENTPILNTAYGNGNYDIGHVLGTGTEGGLAGLGVVNNVTRKGEGVSTSSSPIGSDWLLLYAHEVGHQFGADHTFNASANVGGSQAREGDNAYEPASGSTIMSYAGIVDNPGDNLQEYSDPYFHSASFEQVNVFIGGSGTPNSTTTLTNNIPTVNAGMGYTIPAGTPFSLTASGSDADSGDTLTYTWEQLDNDPATIQGLPIVDNGSVPLFRSFEPTTDPTRVFPRLSDLAAGVNTNAIGEALATTDRSLNFRTTVRDGKGGVNSDDVLITVEDTGAPFAVTSPNGGETITGGTFQTITWDVSGTSGGMISTMFVGIDLSLDGGLTYPISLGSTSNDGSELVQIPNLATTDARIRVRGDGNIFFDISDNDFTINADTGAPGFTITETDGSTIVGEDGLVGGQSTDTYTIARNTVEASTQTVEVNSSGQLEFSTDGITFSSSLTLFFSGTTAQTIHVRGLDDTVQEGIHSGLITHTVTASNPVGFGDYSPSTLIAPVAVTIADDELQPVIGVDFDRQSPATPEPITPNNWTRVSEVFGGSASNLIREDGIATGVGLTLDVFLGTTGAGLNESQPSEVPKHSPDLYAIDGNHLADDGFQLTWTGLTPGTDYNIYLMMSEWFGTNDVQNVSVTAGVTVPDFTQDTFPIDRGVLVNSGLADKDKPLEVDALMVQADVNGEIQITVMDASAGGTGDSIISAAAIQEVGPDIIGFNIIQSGNETEVSEAGTQDSVDVVLTSQPSGNVVINVSSADTGEVTLLPATLTFDNTNWNVAQTVTFTGVDDADADGAQSVTATFSIDQPLTTDDNFDSVTDRLLGVVNADNEALPLVGVDFEDLSGANLSPTNWTQITDSSGSTTNNLINEDGDATAIDLQVAITVSGGIADTPAPTNLPDHPNSLANIGGARFSGGSLILTWSDLTPGAEYDLWLFAAENFANTVIQTVTITGGGTNPSPFTMDTTAVSSNTLLVNSAVANSANSLQTDAVRATADGSGAIQIVVAVSGGADFALLNGAAIQEVFENPVIANLSVTTQGDEAGPTDIVYTVTLSEPNNSGSAITFDFDDLGTGTATSGSDYTAVGGSAQISVANGSATGTFIVPVMNDSLLESLETVIAQISNPSDASIVIGTGTATANITDNETAMADLSVTSQGDETGPVDIVYTVTLSTANNTGGPLTFEFDDIGGGANPATSGSDYTAISGSAQISIADGATTGTFTVAVTDDGDVEPTETVVAQISNPSLASVTVGTASATATITDNDLVNETLVGLNGANDLLVQDINGGTSNDTLTISINGANIRVNDPNNVLEAGTGATQVDANTVDIPVASLTGTGGIIVDTLGGDDTLTIDFGGGNFTEAITFNGGMQTTSPGGDTLVLTGGSTFSDATFTYANNNDGSIDITGTSTITYTGLEPITSNITVTDVTLNFSSVAETITVSDAGGGQTTVDSDVGGESTTFNHPTGTLSINPGDTGVNVIDVGGLAANYPGSITISGGDGGDAVNLNGAITFAANKSLTVNAQTVSAPNTGSDIATTGNGQVTLVTSGAVSLAAGSSITTVDGGINVSVNSGGTATGDFVGISLTGATITTTGGGAISLSGFGGNTADDHGIVIQGGSVVSSTNTTAGAGVILLIGQAGAGAGADGVRIVDASTEVTSQAGMLFVNGLSSADDGLVIANSAAVRSLGTGANAAMISLSGTGGSTTGAGGSDGVVIASSSLVTSIDGGIDITGDSLGGRHGVVMFGGGAVTSTGTTVDAAAIDIVGTAGVDSAGVGLQMSQTNTRVTSDAGSVTIDGDGTTGQYGVDLFDTATVQVGSGTLSVTGTGGTGAGVRLSDVSSGNLVSTGIGDITVTTVAGSITMGASSVIGGATAGGDVILTSDTIDLLGGTIQSTGALTIEADSLARSIGLGGGAGDLNLTDAELAVLADGFSSIAIGDGTGLVDIDTVTLTDPVTIAGATFSDGAGTDINAPSVTLDGNVSPGQSPGILTVVGDFTFAAGDTFTVEIGGTSPGTANTNHDQIDVTGTVTIGTNVTLTTSAFNGFTPSGGESFTIIENDGTDAVAGTFAGLAEGAAISNFLGSGLDATITYAGGSGNDVVIDVGVSLETSVGLNGSNDLLIQDINGGTSDDTLTISINGTNVRVTDPNQTLIAGVGATQIDGNTVEIPIASLTGTGGIIVDTLGGDDTLTIDFSGGNFSEAITFNGGAQNTSPSGDTLILTGGSTFADATFNYTNENDGSIDITGNATISYTGLEPITSNITATNVTLNYSATAETITVSSAGGGQTTVDSDVGGETTTFNDPSGTLTINGGNTGVNTIDVGALVFNYPASIDINGGDGGDTVNLNGLLNLAADKSLSVSALTINTPNTASDIVTSGSGSVTLSATRNILMSSASSISTVDGGITLTANVGGASTGNFSGIRLAGADLTTSGNGAISLEGAGGNTNVDNGIYLTSGSDIRSTKTTTGAGTITLVGQGTATSSSGIYLAGTAAITSHVGDIQLTGNAVDGVGVVLTNAPTVQSLGSGAGAALISIDGTAGAASVGVQIDGGGTVSSVDGDIDITGMGGRDGVLFTNGGVVESTGTTVNAATITITGTAGADPSGVGVKMLKTVATFVPPDNRITSVAGAVFITGDGATAAEGVALEDDADVEVGSGSLTVVGTGGTGAGVRLVNGVATTSFLSTGSADIHVTSLSGPLSVGPGTLIGGAAATGEITLVSDVMDIDGSTVEASGSLLIAPNTPTTSIGLGGGSGGLNLSDAELLAFADGFSSITIGDVAGGTGTVDIQTLTLTDPATISGGTINDNSGTDITAPSVTLDGNVSPGQSPGILTVVGNFAFADNDTYTVEIGGTTPGSANNNHDQIDVTGTVTIGTNVTLTTTSFNGFSPSPGDSFTIIENDGADAVAGTFAGLSEGATISNFLSSGLDATITYIGGDGNDVVVEMEAPPVLADLSVTTQGSETGPVNIVFTVTLDKANNTGAAITFDFDDLGTGSAMSGDDYAAIAANAQISVAAGASTGTITVPVTDDTLLEATETMIAQISNSSLIGLTINTASATANITDNDTATADLSVTTQGDETGPVDVVYMVTLSKTNDTGSAITFDLDDQGTGTATAGADYTEIPANAQISVAAGASSGTLTVPVTDDALLEATETIDARINNSSNPAVTINTATATASIADNDTATADLSVTTQGNEAGPISIVYTVTLSVANNTGSEITFDIDDLGTGTASLGVDYTAIPADATISVADGASTGTFEVAVTDDNELEADVETVIALISNSSNTSVTIGTASATADITDNDTATADLSVTTDGNEAGPVDIVFTVTLDEVNNTGSAITFDLDDLGTGTALVGSDYTAIAAGATISVADGARTGNLTVEVIDDAILEQVTETVVAGILNSSNPDVSIGIASATANITDNETATADLSVTTNGNEVGPVDIVYTVTLSLPNNSGAPITFEFDDLGTGTATSGADYTAIAANAQISIADGDSTGTFTITVNDDALLEDDLETLIAQISSPSLASVSVGTASATATITDNETAVANLSSTDGTEAGPMPMVYTVTLDKVNNTSVPITFELDDLFTGTATSGSDYTAVAANAQVSVPVGSAVGTLAVPVIVDGNLELPETMDVAISGSSNPDVSINTSTATATIVDTANLALSQTVIGNESGPVDIELTVTLNKVNTTGSTITFDLDDLGAPMLGSPATSGADYATVPDNAIISVADGSSTGTFTIAVFDDVFDEGTERFVAGISNSSSPYVLITGPSVDVVIRDDDRDTADLSVTTHGDENGPTDIVFTVTLTEPNNMGLLQFDLDDLGTGTATSGADYVAIPANATIDLATGATSASYTVTVIDDMFLESTETLDVQISHPTFNIGVDTVTAMITDNDVAVADLSATTQGNEAGPVDIVYTVTMDKVNFTAGPITFDFDDLGTGTAIVGSDYTAVPAGSQVTIAVGSDTGTISVPVLDDGLLESTETVITEISNSSFPTVSIGTSMATGNILDDEMATADLSVTTQGDEEGPVNIVYTVTLSLPNDTGAPITFDFDDPETGTATSGADYTAIDVNAVISVPAGSSTGTFVVAVADDALLEATTESLDVQIANPSHPAVTVGTGSATATITDNDTATANLSVTTQGNETGPVDIVYTVTLDKINNTDAAVTFDIVDLRTGSASAGDDYTAIAANAQITVPIGSDTGSLTVQVLDDSNFEQFTETVIAQISNSSNPDVSIGTASATATITDNEMATADLSVTTQGDEDGPVHIVYTVTMNVTNETGVPITFDFEDLGTGTANSGDDYAAIDANAQISIANGSNSGSLTVTVVDDTDLELTETLIARISNSSNAGVTIGTALATADIADNDEATANLTVTTQGNEQGPVNIVFTVTLDRTNDTGLPILFDLDDLRTGSATSGTDYTAIAVDAKITLPDGATSGALTVPVTDDALLEGNETVDARISNPSNPLVTIGTASATANIADNDTATFTIDDVTVAEDAGTMTFTVSLSNPIDIPVDVDVSYADVTATGGGIDYDSATDTVSFAAGTTTAQTVTVAVTDDNMAELTETFTASLAINAATPVGARSVSVSDTGTGTITDNDTATFTIDDVTVAEDAGTMTFTVSLSNPIDIPVDVDVSYADVTATGGGIDYDSTTDTVSFAAGTTTAQTVTVAVTDDNIAELTETFTASLAVSAATPVGARSVSVSDTGTGTITDNDTATFTIDDVTVAEDAGTMTFTVSLSNPIDIPVDVDVSYADVTATGGGIDYDSATDTVSFAAGTTTAQTVTVAVTDDNIAELTETFTASLAINAATPVGARSVSVSDTGTGTITDDDTATFTIDNVTVAEDAGTMTFTVSLSNPIDIPVDVDVSYADVTATGGGIDYDSATDTVSFAAGTTTAQTVTVAVTDDNIAELTETFTASLAINAATSVGARSVSVSDTGTGTITDNDTATFTIDDVTVAEDAGTMTFTVSLSNPIDIPVDVDVSYADVTATGSGIDYDSATDTVSFAAGTTTAQTVTVAVTDDNIAELTETFTASLAINAATPVGARSVSVSDTGTGTITDNDAVAITVEDVMADEGGGLQFTVTLNQAVQDAFAVNVSFTDVSATGGIDYVNTPVTLNFGGAAGETQTFTVGASDDGVAEGPETFTVNLDATNALVDDSDTATGTITDNDTATFTIDDVTVAEDAGTMTFTVSLSNPIDIPVDVDVSYADVTATGGGIDYDSATDTVSFAAGTTTAQTVTVAVTDDNIAELTETFTASLAINAATPVGARSVSVSDTGTGTITDNDAVAITVEDVMADEGGGLQFTVTLSQAVQDAFVVNVSFTDVSATGGIDYVNTPVTLNFAGAAGETQTFTVGTTDDGVLEGPEDFTVNLDATNALVGDSDTATGTINDNDDASVTVEDVTAVEGVGLVFTVTLDNAVQGSFDVDVSFADVSATGGGAPLVTPEDYDNAAQTLTFNGATGETQQLTVDTLDDQLPEPTETFTVILDASNALVTDSDTATGFITDNDEFTADLSVTTDGDEAGPTDIVYTVTLSQPNATGAALTFDLDDLPTMGTATPGADYTVIPAIAQIVVAEGATTGSLTVPVIDDGLLETTETLVAQISNPSSPLATIVTDTATANIADNDTAVADLSVATQGDEEGPVDIVFSVALNKVNNTGSPITFDFADLLAGSATSGSDYTPVPANAQISIADGSNTGSISVPVIDDDALEAIDTVMAEIANSSNSAVTIKTPNATATIADNDTATADLSVTTQGNETGPINIVFTVTLSKTNETGVPISFDFDDLATGSASPGSDYAAVPTNAQILVADGANTGTLTVQVIDDALLEGSETVAAQILNPSNPAVTIGSGAATADIIDNDNAAVTVNNVTATEGNNLTFTVTLDNPVPGGFDVNVSFTDGTATGGADYDNTGVTLNFAGTAGETQQFTVTTTDDALPEATENFTVNLSSTNPLVNDADTGTGSINDNDGVAGPEVDVDVDGLPVPVLGNVDFGDVLVNDPSPVRTFVVTNNGSADVILQPISVPIGFVLTSANFAPNQVLPPAAQVSFTVEMDTSAVGAPSGQLSFANNDSDEADYRINLNGTVLEVSTDLIIDDGDTGFLRTGSWTPISGFGFDGDALAVVKPNGERRAIWAFGGLTPGHFNVNMTWLAGNDRASNVPIFIRDGVGGPILCALKLNQQSNPAGGVISGRPFQLLETVLLTGNTLVVELSSEGTNGAVIADAVAIQPITPPANTPEIKVREDGFVLNDGSMFTFDPAIVGESVSRTFSVRNVGTADVVLQPISVVGTGFSLTSPNFTSGQILPQGATISFTVELDTSAAGGFNAALSFGNNDADESPFDLLLVGTVNPPPPVDLIVDDGDADFVLGGSWTNVVSYGYQADAKAITPNRSGTATWIFNGLTPGDHDVSVTWLSGSDRASGVNYMIYDGVGGPVLAVVPVDQRVAPSGGGVIGGRPFANLATVAISGTTLVVEIDNAGADGAVIADAVRVREVVPSPVAPAIAVSQGATAIGDGGNFNFGSADQGDPQLTRVFTVENTGNADLILQPISVSGNGFTLESPNFAAGQVLAPGQTVSFTIGLSTSVVGNFFGNVSFLHNDNGFSPFDFALTGTIYVPPAAGIDIIDNGDTGFSTTGNWAGVSGVGFGSDALAGNGSNGVETARWEFTGLTAGDTFEVSSTWLRGGDRESAVTYVIRDGAGGPVLATVVVDQTQNPNGSVYGGRPFEVLSNVTISGTSLVVELSTAGSTKAIIADAVRIEKQ